MNICTKYSENKIKTTYASQFIKNFRVKLSVVQNIQFLLFGQLIPEGGFKDPGLNQEYTRTFKSMKTQEMKEEREAEIKQLDDTAQYLLSKDQLNQYNQVKKILMNFAFKDKQKFILSNDIIRDVMDEKRRERKILMVLRDANVEQYIKMNMTEIDVTDKTAS